MTRNSFFISLCLLIPFFSCNPRLSHTLRNNDRKKDVEMITDKGTMVIRLSDSTPLHRDNFLTLVKSKFYDGITFHRVIFQFMVQAGDPATKKSSANSTSYTIPAEIRPGLYHKKGVIAAARMGDDVNPAKASSGSQFYLVQGRIFTDMSLDSVETFRLNGRKIPEAHRAVYKSIGGAPHLDQGYTVFGEVIKGTSVIDSIAAVPTTGRSAGDKPIDDIHIVRVRLIKRKS
ncbi:MAG TPA: peptidylprolyl isomerase [Flavitalea sp.]|nr:peptidylprolyl isomerase [Flavitalea sp.]